MEGLISAIILLFIFWSIWAFTTWRKLKNMENLKEWVAWSICESDGIRWNIPLWVHLRDAQLKDYIQDKYRLSSEEEWESARKIIERYQKELTRSYFDGRLWTLKSIYGITGKDYFIYMLYVYLCENANYGQATVFHLLQNNEIGNRNIVFHKMHYITYMYCKENLALQKNVPAWNESRLKEILDKEIAL